MIKKLLIILVFLAGMTACEKDRISYYEKPDWLQGPLFEQLQSTGSYNEYVRAAERTGYDEFLSSRLNFTVFVPTDEAFQEYYQENGYGSIEDVPEDELLVLLQYHTLQNAWDSVKMGGKTSFGWWSENADNFRTPSLYTPEIEYIEGRYVEYENTFLHVFSQELFDKNSLSAVDYESFFPGSRWSGYHIDRAAINKKEQGAENGFYYEIDRVLEPRTTADKMLAGLPEFSVFKSLIDRFITYDFNAGSSASNSQYDSLFRRNYALNFNLADEKVPDNAYDGYYHVFNTMFIPDNASIEAYFADNFPAYPDLASVPNIIVKYFVEAHMIPNKKLFPTVLARVDKERNDFSDQILFELDKGIVSQRICSNAILYGVDEVINTNAFSTVTGPIIRDPRYKIFTLLLELSGEIRSFFKEEIKHAVFVLSDEKMIELGFAYDEGDPIDFTDDKIFRNNSELSLEEIKAFLQNYISITSKQVDGVVSSFIKTKNNKYLKVGEGKVEGLFGTANILNTYESINGTVLEIDEDLTQGEAYTIEDYLNTNKENYTEFFTMAEKAGMLNEDGDLVKLSLFSGITLLLPSDEAVQAIRGSYIPADDTDFNYRQLLQYQVVSERVMFTDDEFIEGAYGTDLYLNGERIKLTVEASGETLTITDRLNNTFLISAGPMTNIIAANGIIHVVDQVSLY
jgi:uncharacterized surface protein with fasciclin (FAS1) repeats